MQMTEQHYYNNSSLLTNKPYKMLYLTKMTGNHPETFHCIHRISVIQIMEDDVQLFPPSCWKFSLKQVSNGVSLRQVLCSRMKNLKLSWQLLTQRR